MRNGRLLRLRVVREAQGALDRRVEEGEGEARLRGSDRVVEAVEAVLMSRDEAGREAVGEVRCSPLEGPLAEEGEVEWTMWLWTWVVREVGVEVVLMRRRRMWAGRTAMQAEEALACAVMLERAAVRASRVP